MAITVAVDVDEVLGAFVEALAEFHNVSYGTSLTAASFHSYQFSRVWGGTEEESAAKVRVASSRCLHAHTKCTYNATCRCTRSLPVRTSRASRR